jgi:hypothetical protein
MEFFVSSTAALGGTENSEYLHISQIKGLVHGVTPCSLIAILTEPSWLQWVWRTDNYKVIVISVDILESSPERAMNGAYDGDLICGETMAQISMWNVWIQDMNCRPTNGKAWKIVFNVLITAWFIRHSFQRYAKLRYLLVSRLIRPQS